VPIQGCTLPLPYEEGSGLCNEHIWSSCQPNTHLYACSWSSRYKCIGIYV